MNLEKKEINFNIKEVSDNGMFQGYGSTFDNEVDSYGDIIEKGAFAKSLEKGGRNGNGVALLWQHESKNPIGIWREIREDSRGLYVDGQLALTTQQGKEGYELLKIGALNGLSIGYQVTDAVYDKLKNIRTIKEVILWEISLVTFPANTNATITQVKTIFENAQNERELERALREIMSFKAAKYIVSLCDKKRIFKRSENIDFSKILQSLRNVNIKLWDEQKPFPNEYSCRLTNPAKYTKFRRQNNAGKVNGKPIDYIYGIKAGKSELQAIRYSKDNWDKEDARKHCNTKDHILFE